MLWDSGLFQESDGYSQRVIGELAYDISARSGYFETLPAIGLLEKSKTKANNSFQTSKPYCISYFQVQHIYRHPSVDY